MSHTRLRSRHLWLLCACGALLAWMGLRSVVPMHDGNASGKVAGPRATRLSGATPVSAEGRVSGSRPQAGPPLPRRSAFEGAPDLFRYAQELIGSAQSGDAEAAWVLSRVYDYCSAYAGDPAGYAADNRWMATQSGPGMVAMLDARTRVADRCAGFTAADGLSAQAIALQRIRAAQAGSLAAEAALLASGRPLEDSQAYRYALVQRVLASRDPEAYLALSPAMGMAAIGDDAYQGYVAGSQYAELAWQMAACRLGLECGADSALMTSYCANGGICSRTPGQDFGSFVLGAAVPQQAAEKMDEMVETLVKGSGVKP